MTAVETSATREDVVREARSWLRTPYVHMADVKGQGVDCAMLLVRVFCDLALVPAFDPRPYARDWYHHHSEELYLTQIQRYAHQVDEPLAGDLAVYNFGRCVSHAAICVGEGLAVHAYSETRRVELASLEELARTRHARFHSYWSVFS